MTELRIRVCNWAATLLAFAALLTVFQARPAFAQSGAAVLTGTVVDAADKKPAADVIVTVTSPAMQGEQVVVTDSAGFYRIPALPSGVYSLRLEKDGYRPYARDGINLRADSTIRVNADLLPTEFKAEEVVVVAKSPTVDVGSSSTGTNITADFMQRVPVSPPGGKGSASRSFESVAEVTPGAKSDTYGVSISGASSPENGYVVDGLSVNNPGNGTIGTPLSSEFVKEVNVISGGYLPEYGRTTGGVLNAVTKTGSNEFHGSAFSYFTPGALQGTIKATRQNVDSVVGTSPLSYMGDIGFDIGGPIQKDKLWFYAGVDFSRSVYNVKRSFYRLSQPTSTATEIIPGADESYDATSQTIQAIAKLTYAINQNNKLTATGIVSPTTTGGAGRFSIDPLTGAPETDAGGFAGTYNSLAHQLNSAAYDGSLKWSTEFDNKRVLVDTVAGWHHQEDNILPADGTHPGTGGLSAVPSVIWNKDKAGDPAGRYHGIEEFEPGLANSCAPFPGTSVSRCPVTSYSSGGPLNSLHIQKADRYTVGSTLTYLLQGLGHHVIKAGLSLEYTTTDHIKAHAGGTNINERADGRFLDDTEHFGVLVGPDNPSFLEPFHVKSKSIIAGGFVQDSWSVMDKITLNVGLRYDTQQMYGGNGQIGLSMPNEWSPRAGVIYDPTQEGHAKLFANYARYYENVPLGLADASLTGEPSVLATYDRNQCDPRVPPYCQNGPGKVTGDPQKNPSHSPSQKWASFGAGATPVDPSIKPTSSDEIVMGGEYELIKDARAGVSYTRRWLNHWIEDMSRDNLQTFFLGNPGYGIASDFPKAERNYDAVTLYFMKSFSDDWLTSASYTISSLRGNIGGLFKTSNGELDPNHNADFDLKAFTINQYGPLAGDHTHDIKLFGAKDWVFNPQNRLSTGLSLRGRSGEPINFYASDINYGQNINLLLPRGSGGRLPWNYNVDMNLGYRYSFDKDKSLSFSIDVFNLLNFQGIDAVNETYTAENAIGKQGGKLTDVTVFNSDGSTSPLLQKHKSANFLNPTSYQAPRIFRFGIRGTF
jgi:outer membrane receptor protein involved in Fe transport